MDLSYDDVQAILKIIDGSTIEELHLELGDLKLVVRKHSGTGARDAEAPRSAVEPRSEPVLAESTATVVEPGSTAASRRAESAGREPGPVGPPRRGRGVEVKSPMVGTFYRAPAPGSPPFVEVGTVVAEDDIVCIIEVMKLMNSIRAGCRGRVSEICADNAQLVEFGQALMIIEPE